MIYAIYFWWKGWEKRTGPVLESYHSKDMCVYPPTSSRRVWLVTDWGANNAKFHKFSEVIAYLKHKGVL